MKFKKNMVGIEAKLNFKAVKTNQIRYVINKMQKSIFAEQHFFAYILIGNPAILFKRSTFFGGKNACGRTHPEQSPNFYKLYIYIYICIYDIYIYMCL